MCAGIRARVDPGEWLDRAAFPEEWFTTEYGSLDISSLAPFAVASISAPRLWDATLHEDTAQICPRILQIC